MIFIEDKDFHKRRARLLNEDQFFRFVVWLMAKPDAGKVMPGSGGLRKVRWQAKGRGKRGGARIIYFWWMADEKILLLDIYAKNENENLTNAGLKKLEGKIAP